MANDKTPAQSTYQTKTISLVKEINSRGSDTSKDEDFVNVFPELVKNKTTKEEYFKLVKRDGCTSFISLPGTVRGMFYWKDQSKLFVAISDDVYVYNAVTGALITTLNTVFATTTSGHVSFCEFLYDTGAVKLVVTDGTTLSTIDSSNTVVASADADMPIHLPYPIFLDGYLFIVKVNTADIYNSNLNDPLAYTAGDFITAEMRADQLISIDILNNYIIVFGNSSIEYFWDAAIATGSPLQRNDTPIKLTGFLGGIAKHGNKLYFVGEESESQPNVYMLDDFKIKPMGTEAVRRHLASITTTFTSSLKASLVSMAGHDFYTLDTGSSTYVLELETGLWTRWKFQATSQFAITFANNVLTTAAYKTVFVLNNGTTLYRFSPSLYQDNGTNFTCTIITDKFRFDSFRNKTMSKLVVWANRTSSSSLLTIQTTDDDYQNYSSGQTVDLSHERPTITRLGRFRERAFKITFTDNQPLLLQALEVDINLGAT